MVRLATHDAINSAITFLKLHEKDLEIAVDTVRLEEIEQHGERWRITLSYLTPGGAFVGGPRDYKTFVITPTGEVESMKIRKL